MSLLLYVLCNRPGSVVASFKLMFYRDMSQDPGVNVTLNIVAAIKTGKLGDLEVDPESLKLTKVGKTSLHI